ncbi:MAG TPA: hypothetical protein VKX28_26750 [Xanthobacteraceae bacterium]|nr:hypothetical protein [Xanthobacteraceae bacterium]
MAEDIEDLAVSIAAYSGVHWHDLNEGGRAHYRRSAELQIARRKAWEKESPWEPPKMPFAIR